ncbi:uncharacterized protein BDZ99DRAFT_513993 [Mytilinidion resinicola]|uniref:Uncharacterized protein n=1 Tax=Mytilinidion resinicola TaxID=574789 RepID=A0A6A6ZAP1_9PEZI|nr:uncharacterized protein BDZ99DRAFT_513993 [Mytilinidion resinicola]KAF2817773.1 hypothetical protein BDZ99DRAFT_513993 [Mytilinidion resinicola]
MSTTTVPSLVTLPAELRQKILSNLFNNTIRINTNGEVLSATPWQLKSTCKLLKANIEKLEELWTHNEDAKLVITSRTELRAMPALITSLKAKAAAAGKTWRGFQEVESKVFHPNGLAQASKREKYALNLAETSFSAAAKKAIVEMTNVADEWRDARAALYPTLDPEITRVLALDITLPDAVAAVLKHPGRRGTIELVLALRGVASMAWTLGQDYTYAYTKKPYVRMQDRKGGVYPRIEWARTFPVEHRGIFESLGAEGSYSMNVQFV